MDAVQAFAFISYVSENKDIVDQLAEELRTAGVQVWIDHKDIPGGGLWQDAITEAIEKGAFFIACLSEEFNKRSESYMHGELNLALDRFRNMPRTRIWLIPVLLNKTEIPRHLQKFNAVSLFENWSKGIDEILRAMNSDNPEYQEVKYLINSIIYHPEERYHALERLARMREVPGVAVTAVIQAMQEGGNDYKMRMLAASVLGKMKGLAAAEAVSALIKALSDVDPSTRSCAAGALGKIGAAAAQAVPALIKALRDDAPVAVDATQALWQIGQPAVPALIVALGDVDPRVRGCAVGALGKMGPAAADAVPALIRALRDDAPIRLFVAQALWTNWMWAMEDVAALVEALRDDPRVAVSAAVALWQIGQPAVPALTEALRLTDLGKYVEIVLAGIESASRKTGRQANTVPPAVVPGPAGSTQYAVFPDGSKVELPEFRQRKQ